MSWKILEAMLGKSTDDVMVFGLRSDGPIEKRIKISKAMRLKVLREYIASGDDARKRQLLKDFILINSLFTEYATVSERLMLSLDNCVIQDVLNRHDDERRSQRYHALISFLMYAEDYCLFDLYGCVSPVVLYEANGRKPITSQSAFDALYSRIAEAMADAGIQATPVGFSSINDLRLMMKNIEGDDKKIEGVVRKINQEKWEMDFSAEGGGMHIPFAVAEKSIPPMRLKYFSVWHVKLILMRLIEKKMYEQNAEDKKARKMMQKPKGKEYSSMTRVSKKGLEGLADIEMLTICDLVSQSARNVFNIAAPVTFDDGLMETISTRARWHMHSPTFHGGVDDAEAFAYVFTHMQEMAARRTEKANARISEMGKAFNRFVKDVFDIDVEKDAQSPHESI